MRILDSIHSPVDLKRVPPARLPDLAREVRDLIIGTVSNTGGHLGAGLGATDLAVALHYLLDTPHDFLMWDVGHQVQAHKILTERKEAFSKTFRQYHGIGPFQRKTESPYDPFTTGHAGPSISSALGAAVGNRLQNVNSKAVVVIGDASIVNGMALEALNHAGHVHENLVVILNDNEMSISPSVGALSRLLNRVITNPFYNRIRGDVEKLVKKVPKVGGRMAREARQMAEGIKHLLVPGVIFEAFGFRYFGPLDGHNISEMVDFFPKIMNMKGPILIHVITKKGKGYGPAEKDPQKWHASNPFDIATGAQKKKTKTLSYTELFGETLTKLAEKDPRITALTAGMTDGTGLCEFQKKFPARFFDVGIAEEHGVTFSAGLAHSGMKPVAAIYSTFLQRCYDQLVHDVALQNLPVMFCIDRAGLVGEDGPTHHGVFDVAYLRTIPGITVIAPRDGREFVKMLMFMAHHSAGPIAVRYPRGAVTEKEFPSLGSFDPTAVRMGKAEVLMEGTDVLFVALGAMVGRAVEAAKILGSQGLTSTVVNARFVKPMDEETILRFVKQCRVTLTLEEGTLVGGFGSGVLEVLSRHSVNTQNVSCLGIPDNFVEAGPRELLLETLGLTPVKIAETAFKQLAITPEISFSKSY